jgi:phytanoyl-CoA hydroxylase
MGFIDQLRQRAQAPVEPDWNRDGYVILRAALDPAACQSLADALVEAWHEGHPHQLVVDSTTGRHRRLHAGDEPRLTRAVDTHVHFPEARALLSNPVLVKRLRDIFGAPPLYFQTLVFEKGSEQGLHQDTAFVVVDDPMKMVGVWIALEDVQVGSGELRYVAGSHRLAPFEFGPGRRHYNPAEDSRDFHDAYYPTMERRCVEAGLTETKFFARQGDVLIWSADLVHGGSPILNGELTRRSLVAHACPMTANPHFFSYLPDNRTAVPLYGGSGSGSSSGRGTGSSSGKAFYASHYHQLDLHGSLVAAAAES